MEQKYDHVSSEKEVQSFWQNAAIYAADSNKHKTFAIDTPPPTVSGSLHIGHIFSYTHTDIIARYKRMAGYKVVYPLGFDDNGLATERYVEKKRSISPHGMTRSEFIQICLEESALTEEQFESLWRRMGLSVDWNLCYSTIDERSRHVSQASFLDLYKKGFIYRKYEPSLYCTACRTAVAQAELDDADKGSQFIDIAFSSEAGQELVISTTRPELLFSCVALFYNPADTRYTHLAGQRATVAYFGFTVPILAEETVEITKGTGLVMCCTFGDKNDIAWFKKHTLPYKQSIGLDGRWLEETGVLAGLKALAAREKIVEVLTEQGLVRAVKKMSHAVTVHERCKKEIEYLALSQWFLNILDHKERFLAAADAIEWHPSFMKSRYKNWVENIGWDWCLSRQRFYGIPFPIWHCSDCKEIIVADQSMLPLDPQEKSYGKPCPSCNSTAIVPDTDVMDTWNTSSLTPYICASFERDMHTLFDDSVPFTPMAMRPQAHDIIRTWAFYTIVKASLHHNTIPWNAIVISGHVLSTQKEKISKSQGNSPLEPENLLKQYPADVIRYWTASGSLGQDVAFSENQLKIGLKLSVKLWNAFKFLSLHPFDQSLQKQPAQLGTVNEWLLHKLAETVRQYEHYLDQYEFGLALGAVEKFFWTIFCDNYIELIKDQLMNPALFSSEDVQATLWTAHHAGYTLLQLYAPYMPHICERIYQELYKKAQGYESIHTTEYNPVVKSYLFTQSSELLELCLRVIDSIRRLKTEKQLSLKTELAVLTVSAEPAVLELLKREERLIAGIAKANKVLYSTEKLSTSLEQSEDVFTAIVVCDRPNAA